MRDLAYLHPNVTFEFIQEERRLKKRKGEEKATGEKEDEKEEEGEKIERIAEEEEGEREEEKIRKRGGEREEKDQEEKESCERRIVFQQSGGLDAYIRHLCLNLPPLFEGRDPIIRIESDRSDPSSAASSLSVSVRLFFSSPFPSSSSSRKSKENEESSSSLSNQAKHPSTSSSSIPSVSPPSSSSCNVSPLPSSALSSSDTFISFVNSIPTPEGGAHVDGVRTAITRAVNRLLKSIVSSSSPPEDQSSSSSLANLLGKKLKWRGGLSSPGNRSLSLSTLLGKFSSSSREGGRGERRKRGKGIDDLANLHIAGEYLREGVVGLVEIRMQNAEFEGQTKKKLRSKHVRQSVEEIVSEGLLNYFELNPQNFEKLLQKAFFAKSVATAAKEARDLTRLEQTASSRSALLLPGKLADCSPVTPEEKREKEIFIVEGESAAGSAKQRRRLSSSSYVIDTNKCQARDRRTQAILPLRGKILNVEKMGNFRRILENEELSALLAAVGISFTKAERLQANLQALRYSRIILMTDADADGGHILSLLLTFFFRVQPELYEKKLIYVASPPLYKISRFPPTPRDLLTHAIQAARQRHQKDLEIKEHKEKKDEENEKEEEEKREKKASDNDKKKKHQSSSCLTSEVYVWSDEEVTSVLKAIQEYHERDRKVKPSSLHSSTDKDNSSSSSSFTSRPTTGVSEAAGADEQERRECVSFSLKDPMHLREKTKKDEEEEEGTETGRRGIEEGRYTGVLKNINLQRFKGLGEMLPEQLWNTTMNPKTRILKQIHLHNALQAAATISSLMGDDVDARKSILAAAGGQLRLDDLDV
ncbi:dna gyrase subunit b [Cystoisospora suis]|uniref:DNA topoisomerase 2 n=1 Tax=Cystoisospora suis TaxID=483139 RepID=A0A2C6L1G6_9APIC|nr:dna gyrase subunit b [Cystoisospora suis]